MEFVVGLPKTLGKFDYIWVVVDKLTKSTHFISVKIDYNAQHLVKVYVKEIVRLHGFRFLSSQTLVHSSHPSFGENYMMNYACNSVLVQLSIHRRTGKQRGLYKC